MYDQFEEFRADALECGPLYYADGSLEDEKLEAAFRIFQKSRDGTRLADFDGNPLYFGITIVGRLARRESDGSWKSADEDFPSIDEIMRDNLRIMDDTNEDAGSILDTKLWSLLANDAWLLGGIHAQTEFHFASPLRWENLWDSEFDRLTVTGREVVGIVASGYAIDRPFAGMEAIAQCVNQEKAATLSLIDYKEAVKSCETRKGFEAFYNDIPEAAR
jgi:hypothetical protein